MNKNGKRLSIIKPPRLRRGDVIGIVAPASAPPDPKVIDRSVKVLKNLGFKSKLATNVRQRLGFLAGSDQHRAADLMEMFGDPEVSAILCVRGGYGAARILPLLDYTFIRRHPKILIGYSDITSLHCALLTHSGLVSFHGPMLNSELVRRPRLFTVESLLRVTMKRRPAGSLKAGFKKRTISVIRAGIARGELIGGNASILCTTLSTPYQPDFKGKILFLEDVSEEPYRFDRFLTHLLNAGLLQQVSGIAIGINEDCVDPKAATAKEYRQTMMDVLVERLLPLKVPVVVGLPFGHQPWNATLPVGIKARLDGNRGDLTIIEGAVV